MSGWNDLIGELAMRGASPDDGWTPATSNDYALTDGTLVSVPSSPAPISRGRETHRRARPRDVLRAILRLGQTARSRRWALLADLSVHSARGAW